MSARCAQSSHAQTGGAEGAAVNRMLSQGWWHSTWNHQTGWAKKEKSRQPGQRNSKYTEEQKTKKEVAHACDSKSVGGSNGPKHRTLADRGVRSRNAALFHV